jgi:hypothetical protein
MKEEEIKERVGEIYDTIDKLQKELDLLREECSHDDYEVGYYSWRIGSLSIKRICKYCGEVLGEPTKEEQEQFLNENA